jgi:hypothetical protein
MFWSIVVTGCEWNWILPVSDLVLNPRSASWRKSTVYGLNGLRPFKSSIAARPCSFGLFPWVALLSAKKNATAYLSVLKRPLKYSRSCSFVASAAQFPKDWHVTVHPRQKHNAGSSAYSCSPCTSLNC